MTLANKQRALLESLSAYPEGQTRFARIVDLGRSRAPLPPELKLDQNRVEGCLSKLWLVCEFKRGQCFFKIDADSLIVKSIAGLLADLYSGCSPEEILASDPSFLSRAGITQHLTPNRRNALSRVWEKIRSFAASPQTSTPPPP